MKPRLKATLRVLAMALGLAIPAAAQQTTLSLAQIEVRYPRMSPVHIAKCDFDHDGQFTRAEQQCVAGIYGQMYRDNR